MCERTHTTDVLHDFIGWAPICLLVMLKSSIIATPHIILCLTGFNSPIHSRRLSATYAGPTVKYAMQFKSLCSSMFSVGILQSLSFASFSSLLAESSSVKFGDWTSCDVGNTGEMLHDDPSWGWLTLSVDERVVFGENCLYHFKRSKSRTETGWTLLHQQPNSLEWRGTKCHM